MLTISKNVKIGIWPLDKFVLEAALENRNEPPIFEGGENVVLRLDIKIFVSGTFSLFFLKYRFL